MSLVWFFFDELTEIQAGNFPRNTNKRCRKKSWHKLRINGIMEYIPINCRYSLTDYGKRLYYTVKKGQELGFYAEL